jgi:hypothetical protein
MGLKSRFGTFFIWLGILLLFLFIAADIVEAEDLNAWYLIGGAAALSFGIYLSVSGREPPEESARFRTVRRLSKRRKKTADSSEENNGGDE